MSRDEHYVLDLCDELLQQPGMRQHTFDWLRGDPDSRGTRRRLRVDGFWPGYNLVVEFREKQHYEAVPHFDKPGKLTISGVERPVQRAIYDARRDTLIPQNGLQLLVIRNTDLVMKKNGRLYRRREADLEALRGLLQDALVIERGSASPG